PLMYREVSEATHLTNHVVFRAINANSNRSIKFRLVQITAGRTNLLGVCRVDLLSTATCRRRLEFYSPLQCSAMPITHSPRYLNASAQDLGYPSSRSRSL